MRENPTLNLTILPAVGRLCRVERSEARPTRGWPSSPQPAPDCPDMGLKWLLRRGSRFRPCAIRLSLPSPARSSRAPRPLAAAAVIYADDGRRRGVDGGGENIRRATVDRPVRGANGCPAGGQSRTAAAPTDKLGLFPRQTSRARRTVKQSSGSLVGRSDTLETLAAVATGQRAEKPCCCSCCSYGYGLRLVHRSVLASSRPRGAYQARSDESRATSGRGVGRCWR